MENEGLLAQNKSNPKNQEQLDMFVANGLNIVHDQKITDVILSQVQKNPDSVDAIAKATLMVINKLEDSSSSNGIKIEDGIKIVGANQIMGEIINLTEKAGMEPLIDEQKYQAFSLAISMYLDGAVKSGKMTKEQLISMGQDAQQSPEGQRIAQEMQQGQPDKGGAKWQG